MMAALGTTDSSFLRMGSLSGVGHLQSLSGAQQFHNNTFRAFGHGGNQNGIQGMPMSAVLDVSNNALVLKADSENTQRGGVVFGQTSLASQNSQFSLPFLDQGRSIDIWSNTVQSSGTNSYLPCEIFQGRNLGGASSITSLSNQSHDSLKDMHCQGVILPNNSGQISNHVVPFQGWDISNDYRVFPSNIFGNSIDSLIDTDGHTFINSINNRNMDFSFFDR